jgi:hypothetical protein
MPVINHRLLPDWNMEHLRVVWGPLANGDSGDGVTLAVWQDRTVQVVGTFGAAGSVTLQGSNDGGTTWATLTDPQGAALTFTATGLRQILELPHMIRPAVTAGDGTTALNVYVHMRGNRS